MGMFYKLTFIYLEHSAYCFFLFLVGEHCHQLTPITVDRRARRKLIIASILCVFFMIGEVVGKCQLYVHVMSIFLHILAMY